MRRYIDGVTGVIIHKSGVKHPGKRRNMIRNINEKYGMAVEFDSIEEMENTIRSMGYDIPEDGLVDGRDFEVIE